MSKMLLEKFADIPHGKIENRDQQSYIENALITSWDDLNLTDDFTSMEAYKLSGRMENIEWNPPLLIFIIERHGGTVMGSSRAELFKWIVDTSKHTATCQQSGHRQLKPMSKRYNAAKGAHEIVSLILSASQDSRLTWKDDGQIVVVNIAKVVPPGGSQQTEASRRKRFRNECEKLLADEGWQVVRYNTYKRPPNE